MEPFCRGVAEIKHKQTSKIFKIDSAQLQWEDVPCEGGDMGARLAYRASVDHPELGDLSWMLWEYPEGGLEYKKTDVSDHIVVKDFEYGLRHVPDEEEYF